MNLYEIRLEDNILYNTDLLDAFLFECQCALFFVDMTNHKSFDPVKYMISKINKDKHKYPYLKIIIVENKIDLIPEIQNEEYQKYKNDNNNKNIDFITISIKTQNNLDILLNQVYNELSPNNSEKNLYRWAKYQNAF